MFSLDFSPKCAAANGKLPGVLVVGDLQCDKHLENSSWHLMNIYQVQVDQEQEQDWGRQRKQQEQRPQGYCLENVNFDQFYIVSFVISEVARKLGGDIALLSIALAHLGWGRFFPSSSGIWTPVTISLKTMIIHFKYEWVSILPV